MVAINIHLDIRNLQPSISTTSRVTLALSTDKYSHNILEADIDFQGDGCQAPVCQQMIMKDIEHNH